MFNWFKKKTITFNFTTGKITIDKRISPEEVSLMMISMSDGSVLSEALTKNGHKNAKERMEFIKSAIHGTVDSYNNKLDDDSPAISPTSMVNFGPK